MTVATVADFLAAPRVRQTITTTAPSTAAATSWCRLGAQKIPASTPGEALDDDATSLFLFNDIALQKFLRAFSATCSSNITPGSIRLWDRLVGVGSIDPTAVGDKTVNSTALTRYTGGLGVQVWLEVQVAPSTNAIVCSMSSYTNQNGTPGRAGATVTFPSVSLGVGNLVGPLPMQAGDFGVKSVETINIATASAGTTARLIVWLVRPLLMNYLLDSDWVFEREMPFPFASSQIIADGASLGVATIGLAGAETFRLDLELALL